MKKFFRQRDVRETITETKGSVLTAITESALPNSRVLAEGEGIDLVDGGFGTDLTVKGEDASDTNKGIASFDLYQFIVTAGNVVIDDLGIDHNLLTNTHNLTTDIDHNSLTNTHNLTTDISHDSITAGTIAAHDTTATGAELNTLTDNSIANTLHRHSELVASDGSPDPALNVDTAGKVGIGIAPTKRLHVFSVDNSLALFESTDASARITTKDDTDEAYFGNHGSTAYFGFTAGLNALNLNILSNGKVGIGTATPSEKLEVVGTAKIDSLTIDAQATDLAMNTHKITGVVDPVADQDAATKKYVDDNIPMPPGTYYWSIPGSAFLPPTEIRDFERVTMNLTATDGGTYLAPINLPHGAIITGIIVYGSDGTNTWEAYRGLLSNGTAVSMANDYANTEDTTISYGTIDNSTYSYNLRITLSSGDIVYGARVTYTL